jgi:hypothetical protein
MRARVDALAREMKVEARWREASQRALRDPRRGEALAEGFETLGRLPDLVVSSAKIRAELGFHEVTTEEERVRDVVAWCRTTR